jgi:hypothetical protein
MVLSILSSQLLTFIPDYLRSLLGQGWASRAVSLEQDLDRGPRQFTSLGVSAHWHQPQ